MSAAKKDFFGKEVADAIKEACTSLQAAQENLDIEVIETGSTGIFGLIRKKAHIRASVKGDGEESAEVAEPKKKAAPKKKAGRPKKAAKKEQPKQESVPETEADAEVKSEKKAVKKAAPVVEKEPLTEETIEAVREQLSELLTRMGFPSEVKTEVEGVNLHCHIGGDHQEALTGQEGKILDSLQYLMRKMITRSVNQRVRLSIDVGDFRERREQDLKEQAVVLAAKVKEDGKTQAIPALNPSERRIVHMTLQDDKEIRSRSVGEGLFKKILIYKPGKGKRGGQKRKPRPRNTNRKKT